MTTKEHTNVTYFHGENADGYVEPFTWNPELPITYDIDVPPDLVSQLTEFLTGLGIPLNPELQVSAVNSHPLHANKFTGVDIPDPGGHSQRPLVRQATRIPSYPATMRNGASRNATSC